MKNCHFDLKEHTESDTYVYECQHGTKVRVDSIPKTRTEVKELSRWGKLKCKKGKK